MLIPAPVTFQRSLTSLSALTGPLCTPIRNWISGYLFNVLLISEAHSTGASGLLENTGRFGLAEMRGFPNELIKLLKYLALIVNQEFRKAHHVHEQDMGDFEMKILFALSGHVGMRTGLRAQNNLDSIAD
jgi:hypothetical protein